MRCKMTCLAVCAGILAKMYEDYIDGLSERGVWNETLGLGQRNLIIGVGHLCHNTLGSPHMHFAVLVYFDANILSPAIALTVGRQKSGSNGFHYHFAW